MTTAIHPEPTTRGVWEIVNTASIAPEAEIEVTVTVTQMGEHMVTIGTDGSTTLIIATTDDDADEYDGSVTATVEGGDGYTVGSAASAMKKVASFLIAVAIVALTACDPLQSPTPPFSETLRSNLGTYRQDLPSGVVVAFVEGLPTKAPGRLAYVTHVASGSQVVLDIDGKLIHRHDGREDGRRFLDAILGDADVIARIKEGLATGEDLRPQTHTIHWIPSMKFGGITFGKLGNMTGSADRMDGHELKVDDLGLVLYRIAFRGDGYAGPGYSLQDGDATFLNPGTQVYSVSGYSERFRLATVEDGRVVLYEADLNPLAETGAGLLDIRGKVSGIDVLEDTDAMTVIGKIEDKQTIEQFVEMLLSAPVDQKARKHNGQRYFLGLRLADGTSVVRAFWLETGELSRGILAGPAAVTIVTEAVPDR